MKNINQKIVILAIFVVVATGIYLFWPRDNEVTEISQPVPAPQEQNQPVQAKEATQEPADSSKPIKETAVQSESMPEQTQTLPITAQQTPQSQKSIEKPATEQPINGSEAIEEDFSRPVAAAADSNSYVSDSQPLIDEIRKARLSPEQQRHQERYEQLTKDLQPTVTPEQAERMRQEMLKRIPQRYRKYVENLEQMKQDELKSRKAKPYRYRHISDMDSYLKELRRAHNRKVPEQQPPETKNKWEKLE